MNIFYTTNPIFCVSIKAIRVREQRRDSLKNATRKEFKKFDRRSSFWEKRISKNVNMDEGGHPIGWINREYDKSLRPYREDVDDAVEVPVITI